MRLSSQDLFSKAQTIGTAIGDTASTDVLDFGAHGAELDSKLQWFVALDNTALSTGAATLAVALQTSDDNNNSFTTVRSFGPFAKSALIEGAHLVQGEALPTKDLGRYVRLLYTGAGQAFSTAPKITAGLLMGDYPVS